jgi:type IV pilus biogenesis protein CpaD/CtpE
MDRLIFEFINAAAAALTITIPAGTSAAAHQAKDLAIALAATGGGTAKRIVGPLESARFMKADGTIDLVFLAASSTPNCTVRCYRLPKHVV